MVSVSSNFPIILCVFINSMCKYIIILKINRFLKIMCVLGERQKVFFFLVLCLGFLLQIYERKIKYFLFPTFLSGWIYITL